MKYFLIVVSYLCKDPSQCFKHEAGAMYHKCKLCQPMQPIDKCIELEEVEGTNGKQFKIKDKL